MRYFRNMSRLVKMFIRTKKEFLLWNFCTPIVPTSIYIRNNEHQPRLAMKVWARNFRSFRRIELQTFSRQMELSAASGQFLDLRCSQTWLRTPETRTHLEKMPRYLFIPLMYPHGRRKLDFMFAMDTEKRMLSSNACNRNETRTFIGRSELIGEENFSWNLYMGMDIRLEEKI